MVEKQQRRIEQALQPVVEGFGGIAGVHVDNLSTGESFQYQADKIFPAASIIKLPVLWEFFRQVEQEGLEGERRFAVSEADRVGGAGVLQAMGPGLQPTLYDLATLMIVVSDNQATNMLLGVLGMERVNQGLRRLGLKKTVMQRLLMDHSRIAQGFDNLIAAGEIGKMLEMLVRGQGLGEQARARMLSMLEMQQFNELLPAAWPEETRFPHKTGWMTGVLHDAGVLFLDGMHIVIVVLTRQAPSSLEAEQFIREVGRTVYDYWSV